MRALHHQHLRPAGVLAHRDHGRRLADLLAHGRDSRRMAASRAVPDILRCMAPARTRPSTAMPRRSATTARSRSPSTWSCALYGPGGFYEQPPVGADGRLRHQPARPSGVRGAAGAGASARCGSAWAAPLRCASRRWARATARSRRSCSAPRRPRRRVHRGGAERGRPRGARGDPRRPVAEESRPSRTWCWRRAAGQPAVPPGADGRRTAPGGPRRPRDGDRLVEVLTAARRRGRASVPTACAKTTRSCSPTGPSRSSTRSPRR